MNDPIADLFLDRQRTQPWHDDEFLVVDGWRLVYAADPKRGISFVRLPGCRSVALADLRAAGYDIAMPKRIRCGA